MTNRTAVAALLAAVIGAPAVSQGVLVRHYELDETTNPSGGTTAVDSTGNSNGTYGPAGDGPLVGQPSAHPALGTSASFDANNDEVVLDSSLGTLTSNFTLAAWVRRESTDGIQRILSGPGGWGWGFAGDQYRFTTYGILDYDTSGAATPALGEWAHVAVTFDASSDANFYLNGTLVQTVAGGSPANPTGATYAIGHSGGGSERFLGGIDDVRVYNEVLSSEAIAQLAVPEPSAFALLAVGAASVLGRRKRR